MTPNSISFILLLMFLTLSSCGNDGYEGFYFPTHSWKTCSPEEVGVDSEKLNRVYGYCSEAIRKTDAFIIIKNGYIIEEGYFGNTDMETLLSSYSIAKNFVSALIGIAIDQGYLHGVNESVCDYFSCSTCSTIDPIMKDVNIRHLLTMTSGLMWSEDDVPFVLTNDIFNLKTSTRDYAAYVLDKPVIHQPGTVWNYSSGMPILLSALIEAATGQITFEFAEKQLFIPLGINSVKWLADPTGHTIGAWGLSMTARDFAKLGLLYLNNGYWEGRQVVSENWVVESTNPASSDIRHYGYLWWLSERYPEDVNIRIPGDSYFAVGLFQSYIIVIPSLDLVLVRFGSGIDTGESGWDTPYFISLVVDSLIS